MYNLSAITSEKQSYYTIWTEAMSGSAGKDLASDFICILNKIASDEPHINNIAGPIAAYHKTEISTYHRLYWNFLAVKTKSKAS